MYCENMRRDSTLHPHIDSEINDISYFIKIIFNKLVKFITNHFLRDKSVTLLCLPTFESNESPLYWRQKSLPSRCTISNFNKLVTKIYNKTTTYDYL